MMEILFHRLIGHYMLQSYIPSILLVMTSWVSFWLEVHGSPARVGIGVTTILSMITLYNGVRYDISRVSYIKALDVWFGVCIGFVVGALLEYALVHYLTFNKLGLPNPFLSFKSRNAKINDDPCLTMTIANNPQIGTKVSKRTKETQVDSSSSDSPTQTKDEQTTGAYVNPLSCLEFEEEAELGEEKEKKTHEEASNEEDDENAIKPPLPDVYPIRVCVKGKCDAFKKDCGDVSSGTGKIIDRVCRVFFPAAFITFNIVYWMYYIQQEVIATHVFNNY
ncbi:gamma-aminobutyric acid receptor subunit gamma-4-like [Amphiura filiformis]|uniref:gamma-aminobutyric acid receptor subunit gamma-4-like n=1 Tax=Amphiura filiformis TaxID=82378 RepID=UPI003B2231D4